MASALISSNGYTLPRKVYLITVFPDSLRRDVPNAPCASLAGAMGTTGNTGGVPPAQQPSVDSLTAEEQRLILKPWCMPTPDAV